MQKPRNTYDDADGTNINTQMYRRRVSIRLRMPDRGTGHRLLDVSTYSTTPTEIVFQIVPRPLFTELMFSVTNMKRQKVF